METNLLVSHFEQLIDGIEDRMIRSIARILDEPNDAEDAFQNALMTIWRKLATMWNHPNSEAIVLRVCVDAAYDVLRKKESRKRFGRQHVFEAVPDPTAPPPERLSEMEVRSQLLAAVRDLPRNQSLAVHLRFVEELPYREIAAVIGCAESTARKHVERGVSRLRQCVVVKRLNYAAGDSYE